MIFSRARKTGLILMIVRLIIIHFSTIQVARKKVAHNKLTIYCKHNIVEGDATRGTTTLVYLQLHISLYTGTVHVLSRVAGIRPLV